MQTLLLISVLCIGLVGNAGAAVETPTAAVYFESATAYTNNSGGGGIGFFFAPSSNIQITQLGFFDLAGDGFENGDSHFVGIYDATGTLLAGTTVYGSNSSGESYESMFWYAGIDYIVGGDSLILEAGTTYYILGEAGSDKYVINTTGFGTNGIDYLGYAFYRSPLYNADLNMGKLVSSADSASSKYFGPNFRFAPVPIPGGLWLLGSGLVFLMARKQRPFLSR